LWFPQVGNAWHNRGVREPIDVNLPFRWDLVTPDQLGSLLAGTTEPDLRFLDALVECTGKVLARSGNLGPSELA
jgi:hypothetical protein